MATGFDGAVKTATRKSGLTKDSHTVDLKSLNGKGITTVGALAGTTATDSKLIHGDRWQEIKGNQTEHIEDDLKTQIDKNETWTVDENLTFKVKGKTKDTRVEDVKEYYLAESRFEYFLEHTDKHHDKDHQINPTHTFDILNVEGEYKNVDLAVKATVFEAKGTVVDVTVAKAEAWGFGAEAFGFGVAAGHFQNEAVAIDVQEIAAKAEIKEIHTKMAAMNAQIGASRVVIMPVRIGICIAVHIDSPWA